MPTVARLNPTLCRPLYKMDDHSYRKAAQKDLQSGEKRGFSAKRAYFAYVTEPRVPVFAAIKDFFSGLMLFFGFLFFNLNDRRAVIIAALCARAVILLHFVALRAFGQRRSAYLPISKSFIAALL